MGLETELKDTIDNLGKAFDEFKKTNDGLIKKGVTDALAEQKLLNISQKLDDLTGLKADLEKRIQAEADANAALERKVNLLRMGGQVEIDSAKALQAFEVQLKSHSSAYGRVAPSVDQALFDSYKGGFALYLRKGEKAFSNDEHKAMLVGSDPDGGYMVTPDMTGRIVQRVFDLSNIRAIASVQVISTDRLEGVIDINEASTGWVGETQARTTTGTPQVGKWEIPTHELFAQPEITQKLVDDAAVDIEAWLAGKVADKFARTEGAAFIVGDGIGKPRGFTTYTTVATADATRAWGSFEHVLTGANGDFAAANAADVLFDLEGAFKPAYLANANWVTRRSVITKVRKFKQNSDNQYLWQPGLQAGKPPTLIGYPIVMAEDMPALATGSLSMALGDFREGYQIVDRVGIRLLRDPYTNKPYIRYYTTKRVGGAAIHFEAIKFLKFAS